MEHNKMLDLQEKIKNEKNILSKMIRIYCKGHKHSDNGELCQDCKDLLEYSHKRIDQCPFMETKTFCSNCKIHCYKGDYREKTKFVMKYAGPRMIFRAPVLVIKHFMSGRKDKNV